MNAPARPKSDFADWLSPMLVKELRQGMRSRTFSATFFTTQGLMILGVVFSVLASAGMENAQGFNSFLSGLFWFMIGLPLLALMPFRGFGALSSEMKANTLELVFLSRLNARRILFGKWFAIITQTLLLITSILPYVVLRYFMGGVDLLLEVQALVLLVIVSALLTAGAIALSPFQSKLLRVFFVIGMIICLQYGLIFLMMAASGGMGGGGTSLFGDWKFDVFLAAYAPAFAVLSLEIAAHRIAPQAESHALIKRLVGVWVLLCTAALAPLNLHWQVALASGFLVLLLTVDTLAESVPRVRSVYLGFLARGLPGRVAMLFFAPGWPSGSIFLLALFSAGAGALFFSRLMDSSQEVLTYVAFCAALVFPAACIRLFSRTTPHFLAIYIGIQFVSATLLALVLIASEYGDKWILSFLMPLPTSVFILSWSNQVPSEMSAVFLWVTVAVCLLSFAVLLLRSLPLIAAARRMFPVAHE